MLNRKLGILSAALGIASSAEAGNLTGDCSGWQDTGYWSVDHYADVTATAKLQISYADDWLTVEEQTVVIALAPYSEFSIGGEWAFAGTLDGTYRIILFFDATVHYGETSSEVWHYYNETASFVCEPPPPPPPPPPPETHNDPRTPGYWKTHPESWPVSSLDIGGQTYDQACLLAFLGLPTNTGDTRIKLIHHLIAAKLNLLPNAIPGIGSSDPSIAPTVDAADAFLIATNTTINCGSNTISGSKLSGAQRNESNALKDALDAYNNGPVGTTTSPLSYEDEGGCTAVNGSQVEIFALAIGLFFLRRKR